MRRLRLYGFNRVAEAGTAETAGFSAGDCMVAVGVADFDCCRFQHFPANYLVIQGLGDEYGEEP